MNVRTSTTSFDFEGVTVFVGRKTWNHSVEYTVQLLRPDEGVPPALDDAVILELGARVCAWLERSRPDV